MRRADWSQAATSFRVVALGHVGEAVAELGKLGSHERVHSGEVDVIGEDHELARLERCVHRPGGVGENHNLDPERPEYAHREHDFFGAVSLVRVDPPRHDEERELP